MRGALFVVNRADELQAGQTTAMLVQAALGLGCRAWLCGVGDWVFDAQQGPGACARPVRIGAGADREQLVETLAGTPPETVWLSGLDLVVLRTNPGRDPERRALHQASLGFARLARRRGARVVNDPDGLARWSTKLALMDLPPRLVPMTLVTARTDLVAAFAGSPDRPVVLKPLDGTRGQDVEIFEGPDDSRFAPRIQELAGSGYIMAQDFLPEATAGDTRVVLLDGRILEVDGRAAAIRRIPAPGDFRSNLHAGGQAAPARITPSMRETVEAVGPRLVSDGIRLAGLDLVGESILEINVFSTGGLRDAERFADRPFSREIMRRLLARGEP